MYNFTNENFKAQIKIYEENIKIDNIFVLFENSLYKNFFALLSLKKYVMLYYLNADCY